MDIEKINLTEAIAFLGAFKGYGAWGGYGIDATSGLNGQGNLYNIVNGGGGGGGFYTAYYWLSTQWYNKWQRYLGRYLYLSNAYAKTAINSQVTFIIGKGQQFVCSDENKQKEIDEWCKLNKWQWRNAEAFKNYLIDGEIFYRIFDQKVRFVDPDLIYGDLSPKDQYLGIVFDEDDNEEIDAYNVHRRPNESLEGESVSAKEIQHRKAANWGQRRGFSWLLPVASDLLEADALTNNCMSTSQVLAKIAFFRKHQANQQSVKQFRSDIASQPINSQIIGQNGTPQITPCENIENYLPGSIPDISDTIDIQPSPTALDGNAYVALLDATLRKVASYGNLPMGVYGNQGDRGAYAAEMVQNSYIVLSLESMQAQWAALNLELLEKVGFDVSDVQCVSADISTVDVPALIQEAQFGLDNMLLSPQSVSEKFDWDYNKEKELWEEHGELVKTNEVEEDGEEEKSEEDTK